MDNFFEIMMQEKKKQELGKVLACNEKTAEFGLTLTEEDVTALVAYRNDSLKKYQRMELGAGILEQLIFIFCDSQYLNQNDYLKTMMSLQDIFYLYKNESVDELADEELMTFMREQFDGVCAGDLDYLESTCLERFTRAVRAGYDGFQITGGQGEYSQFDEEPRWDKELYMEVIRELFWE